MVNMSINDREMEVYNTYTILQVSVVYNEEVPRFCFHEQLSIAGNCRICLIEEMKSLKLLIACATNVVSDMAIFTETNKVLKARDAVLEFLLINHPLDCPICDQGGECDLQDITNLYGADIGRFYEYKRFVLNKNCGVFIKTLMNRCIHCTRCVRFAIDIAGIDILGVVSRGNLMEIGFYIDVLINSEISGNIIDLCPVGALTSKPYAFVSRS